MMAVSEARRLVAEALGTASLLAAIVGSGIVVAEGGDAPVQLFQHAIVVGAALTALILTFGPVSGAHFNPAVTVADAWFGGMGWGRAARYLAAQLLGAVAGTVFTNVAFGLPAVTVATTLRPSLTMTIAEGAATAGLLVVIFGVVRSGGGRAVAAAVGIYIAAAIMFTSSDAFANPAVTVARMLSDTWTGIHPASAPAFLAGQAGGTLAAIVLIGWLFAPRPDEATRVVVPAAAPASVPLETTDPAPGVSLMRDPSVPTVLFLCVHNAGRSQMAAGWLRHLAAERVRVLSGGSEPAETLNPAAVQAMAEEGIDITGEQPRRWTEEDLEATDVVITMGCGDECPYLPGKRYLDWELTDPAGKPIEEVRTIRDDIRSRVIDLLTELSAPTSR